MTIEYASNDGGAGYAETALRNAPAHVVAAVNRARTRIGLPPIPHAGAGGNVARACGVYWDPASPHRPRGSALAATPRAPAAARGTELVTRVLVAPCYMDAAAQDVRRSLPEAIAPGAFGTAAGLNAAADWSLNDDHDGPVYDYAGSKLRAVDTAHGLVLEWLPNLRLPWARDAVHAIEEGRNAVSVSMLIDERRIAHVPHPVELVVRARLSHVALLTRGQRGAYSGGRAKVFRFARAGDQAELQKQVDELFATCRWHARQSGGRC